MEILCDDGLFLCELSFGLSISSCVVEMPKEKSSQRKRMKNRHSISINFLGEVGEVPIEVRRANRNNFLLTIGIDLSPLLPERNWKCQGLHIKNKGILALPVENKWERDWWEKLEESMKISSSYLLIT